MVQVHIHIYIYIYIYTYIDVYIYIYIMIITIIIIIDIYIYACDAFAQRKGERERDIRDTTSHAVSMYRRCMSVHMIVNRGVHRQTKRDT